MAQIELQCKLGGCGDLLVAAFECQLKAFGEGKFLIGRHGRSLK